jgi:uncharacterized protein HemX
MTENSWAALLIVVLGFALGCFYMSRKKDRKNARRLRKERRQLIPGHQGAGLEEPQRVSSAAGEAPQLEAAEGAIKIRQDLEKANNANVMLESELKALGLRLKKVQTERDSLARLNSGLRQKLECQRPQTHRISLYPR